MKDDRVPTAYTTAPTAGSAFVVHLAIAATDTLEAVQGRIEHITSGRSMRFASAAELIAFMQQILRHGAEPGIGR